MIRRAALAVAFALLAAVPGAARADVIERVIAVVNDDAIFLSELRRRSIPFLDEAMSAPSEVERMARLEQLYRQLLDHMVDELLIQQAARRMQVRVTSEDVDRAIRNVMRQSGLSESDFWAAVRAQGFTEAQYRSDVRRQLLRLKVLNQRARGRVNITEDAVRQRYDQEVRRANIRANYDVSHVFFAIPAGASATEVAAIRRRAAEVRESLTRETFPEAMETIGGGALGSLQQGDLPAPLEQAIAGLPVGGISDPVQGPSGIHIFLLNDRQSAQQATPPYEEMRQRIYRQMLEQAMERQETIFIEELRRTAVISRRL